MGIRQAINEKPAISIGVTAAVIIIAIIVIVWELTSHHAHNRPAKSFYSDDNGATYFTDDVNRITPFTDANGKDAVQAVVYKCGDSQPFVAYLMRYTDEGKKVAQAALSNPNVPHSHLGPFTELEVKRPKDSKWIRFDPKNAKAYSDVMSPACPDGGNKTPKLVLPGQE